MLSIRGEQKATVAEARFAERLVEVLTTRFARHVPGAGAAALHGRVREALARGRAHGLRGESSLAAFTLLAVMMGPDFELHPLIRRALEDRSLSPGDRGRALVDTLASDEWKGAIRDGQRPQR